MKQLSPDPLDGWLPEFDWSNEGTWEKRLLSDRDRAIRNQSAALREITKILYERALEEGALGFALTGSTARNKRTQISDLDYHVIGHRPQHNDLPDDVDVYATDEVGMWRKLNQGDDFIQWTLRYGCILFDSGIFRAAMLRIASGNIWPDSAQKLARLPGHIELARRLVAMGDRDAAQDQVRATLTSLARALLLQNRIFPRARSELPRQLVSIGGDKLGSTLNEAICDEPSLECLGKVLDLAEALSEDRALRSVG